MNNLIITKLLAATCLLLSLKTVAQEVSFQAVNNVGVLQATVGGTPVLTGCGFGFIGSVTGADNMNNITTCLANNGGVMRSFNGTTGPTIGHSLTFQSLGGGVIAFTGSVGPGQYEIATISMPFDGRKDRFTHYRHSGQAQPKRYADIPGTYTSVDIPNQPIGVQGTLGQHDWGEMIGPDYTARVTITKTSQLLRLFFVNHPHTNNVEFSFGNFPIGKSVQVSGFISVSKTDPAVLTKSSQTFEAEGARMYHQVGRADGLGWSANVLDGAGKFLTFGPYEKLDAGVKLAKFRLMTDNITATPDVVATVEVVNALTSQVIARRAITRNEFAQSWTYQDFNLSFTAPTVNSMEFRVLFGGSAYINQDRVTVESLQ